MTSETSQWSGPIPGYGDATLNLRAISIPNELKIVCSDGRVLQVPEAANNVWLSEGGQIAWMGNKSDLIYIERISTGRKGYGQWSFAWIGETPRFLETKEEYQATSGGWRYVDDAGSLVPYGPTYSGPPLWEYTKRGDVTIGQGPEDADGVCGLIAGDVVRQLLPGVFRNIRFRRYGDLLIVCAVNYPEHFTTILSVTRTELAAHAPLSHTIPVPVPPSPPESTTMYDIPNAVDKIANVKARLLAVGQDLSGPCGAFKIVKQFAYEQRATGIGVMLKPSGNNCDGYSTDWILFPDGSGCDILGDGGGQNNPQWGVGQPDPGMVNRYQAVTTDPGYLTGTPSQPPSQPPEPSIDLQPLLAKIAALEVRAAQCEVKIQALEQQPTPSVDLTKYAKYGDLVKVGGRIPGLMFRSLDVIWNGTIVKPE